NWAQLHSPPRTVLCDPAHAARHATATRGGLSTTGLRAVIHAPDDLLARAPEHDRALAGLIDYATIARAQFGVYHGRYIRAGARHRALGRARAHAHGAPRAPSARDPPVAPADADGAGGDHDEPAGDGPRGPPSGLGPRARGRPRPHHARCQRVGGRLRAAAG